MIRYVGLDLHKEFIQMCILDEKGNVLEEGRIGTQWDELTKWREKLGMEDQVAFESCPFAWTVHDILEGRVGRIVISNAYKTRAIAEARIKTDKVDARILAELLRADFLPSVWMPDEKTQRVRILVTHRHNLVKRIISLKNSIHARFHQRFLNCPHSDLFGRGGRSWIAANREHLPEMEQRQLDSTLRILECVEGERQGVEIELAEMAYHSEEARLLMTIPGIDYPVALALLAAIGEINRFPTPEKLCAYLGLVPSVHQSGNHEFYGRITKHGNAAARWMLVQSSHQLTRLCTPMRPFYERIRAKKGRQTAVVAVARKLATLAWHLLTHKQPYRYANARCIDKKFSRLQIQVTGERRKSGPKPGEATQSRKENTVHLSGRATFPRNLEEVHAEWKLPRLEPPSPGEQQHIEKIGGQKRFLQIR